jgi:LysR family transcriptional regulator for bpeEF and oprC
VVIKSASSGISTSRAGREYYEKARRLLEDLEEIDAAFNTARNKPKGHLRIRYGYPARWS